MQDVARTRHGAVAQTIASSIFYPADSTLFAAGAWPVRDVLSSAFLMLVGAGVVFGAAHLKLPRRARIQLQPQPV